MIRVARPKKETADKRDRRMTLYMTGLEEPAIKDVAEAQNRPVTQIVQEAIRSYLDRLAEPESTQLRSLHSTQWPQQPWR